MLSFLCLLWLCLDGTRLPAQPDTTAPKTGSVNGVVLLRGRPPAYKQLNMYGDAFCTAWSGLAPAIFSQPVACIRKNFMANVFVYVSDGLDRTAYRAPNDTARVTIKCCSYQPRVLGVITGQSVLFINTDSTMHNVHATSAQNQNFNMAMPVPGSSFFKTLEREEVMLRVTDDIHEWQNCFIGVLPHPFFAVTGIEGSFRLNGLPPGTYSVTAWHETLGTRTQQVTVTAGKTTTILFSYPNPDTER